MVAHPRFRDWLSERPDAFDALILDIDGVLVRGREPMPGSAALLALVRGQGVPFVLLTNDGSRSPEEKSRFLAEVGIRVDPAEIVSSSDGLVEVAQSRELSGTLFFVMGNLGDPCYAEGAGLRATRELRELGSCRGVIVGEKNYDWEPTFNAVINCLIQHPDRLLIVANPDEFYPTHGGEIRIAAGGKARFIQRVVQSYGVSFEPIYLGKPYTPIYEHAHGVLEKTAGKRVPHARVLTLGDSLVSDVRGAHDFGYRSALVLTGVTTQEMLEACSIEPDAVFEAL